MEYLACEGNDVWFRDPADENHWDGPLCFNCIKFNFQGVIGFYKKDTSYIESIAEISNSYNICDDYISKSEDRDYNDAAEADWHCRIDKMNFFDEQFDDFLIFISKQYYFSSSHFWMPSLINCPP